MPAHQNWFSRNFFIHVGFLGKHVRLEFEGDVVVTELDAVWGERGNLGVFLDAVR
jgi:hypothetical protein